MKRPKVFRFLFVLCVLASGAFLYSGFDYKESESAAARTLSLQLSQDLQGFVDQVGVLGEAVAQLQTEEDLAHLQQVFLQTRNQFKKAEYLVAYSSPETVKDYINGAPLRKIDKRTASSLVVLDPEGLQILDEMIFGEEVMTLQPEMLKKMEKLRVHSQSLVTAHQGVTFSDREIFEAMRAQLVRILTLGITGFDTPLSGNALPEALITCQVLHQAYLQYHPALMDRKADLAKRLEQTFSGMIGFLEEHQDFDSFDRLHFTRQYIQPLYQGLQEAHTTLGFTTIDQITRRQQPVNYHEGYIFSASFLNPAFYTSLDAGIPHPAREQLGKLLFFDPVLSSNNERACASCHQPQKAFTDGRKKSLALNFEGTVERNAPTLVDAIFAERYFHDLRALKLEKQTEHVIFDKREFNTTVVDILKKLKASEDYRELFRQAFPHVKNEALNPVTLKMALAAYVRSLQSFDSPVDQYLRGELDSLPAAVQRGFNLFMGKAACGTCHFAPVFNGLVPPSFTESESEVLGVPATPDTAHTTIDPDLGRYAGGVRQEEADIFIHSFKTPTVRNIALTAPYMHNGVYDNLEQVLDFYNRGGGTGLGLDVPNQTLPTDPLGLTQQEMDDIIVFMEALTDTSGLTSVPTRLPVFPTAMDLNDRVIGGKY